MLIAPQECEAWIVGPDHASAAEGVKLCDAHADRITVPFGWGLHNERPTPKKRRRRKAAAGADAPEAAPKRATKSRSKAKAKAPTPKPEPEPESEPEAEAAVLPELEREPLPDADSIPGDDPTMQLPVVDLDAPDPAEPPAPADVPVRADHVADAIAEADDPRHLQVVAQGGAAAEAEDVQPSFWDDTEADDQLEPSDQTPLLKRAFRVVRDD